MHTIPVDWLFVFCGCGQRDIHVATRGMEDGEGARSPYRGPPPWGRGYLPFHHCGGIADQLLWQHLLVQR